SRPTVDFAQTKKDPSALVVVTETGPSLNSPSRFGWIARFIRRVILRLLRHHDEHQRSMNAQLAQGIAQLAFSHDELHGSLVAAPNTIESTLTQLRDLVSRQQEQIRNQDAKLEHLEQLLKEKGVLQKVDDTP